MVVFNATPVDILNAINMNFSDLLTIFRVVIGCPELVTYTSEDEISGVIGDKFFGIKVCCGGSGAILTLSDSSKIDFDLDGENKEIFDTLFKTTKEQSKKYNYNKLLEELNRYEGSRSAFGDYQSVQADDLDLEQLL